MQSSVEKSGFRFNEHANFEHSFTKNASEMIFTPVGTFSARTHLIEK